MDRYVLFWWRRALRHAIGSVHRRAAAQPLHYTRMAARLLYILDHPSAIRTYNAADEFSRSMLCRYTRFLYEVCAEMTYAATTAANATVYAAGLLSQRRICSRFARRWLVALFWRRGCEALRVYLYQSRRIMQPLYTPHVAWLVFAAPGGARYFAYHVHGVPTRALSLSPWMHARGEGDDDDDDWVRRRWQPCVTRDHAACDEWPMHDAKCGAFDRYFHRCVYRYMAYE